MSSDIELPLEHPAPLPWYPPTCTKFEGKTKYDHLQSLARWTHINIKKAEREIEATYYLHSSEKNFHEWGSRVKAAMNKVRAWIQSQTLDSISNNHIVNFILCCSRMSLQNGSSICWQELTGGSGATLKTASIVIDEH